MFKPCLGIFWPRSIVGVVMFATLAAFMVNTFIAIDRHAHSVSDTIYGIFPFWSGAFLLYQWLAATLDRRGWWR